MRARGWRFGKHGIAAIAVVAIIGMAISRVGIAERAEETVWRLNPVNPGITLDDVEREVVLHYRIPDVSIASLEQSLANGSVVVFDVRTREEYEAGHIPGAIRVEPGVTAAAFLAEHGHRLGQQPAVFYCAVGVRSSRMLRRLMRDVELSATAGMRNLRGGAFRWVAEGRQLVAGAEPGLLHPFDDDWGQLLRRTLAAR